MRDVVLVAIGGALGAVSRFGVTMLATRLFGRGFPWGTLAVNVAGCFVIGVVLRVVLRLESLGDEMRPQVALWHYGVAVGFLGGLTTFSTFSADAVTAFQSGRTGVALLNIAANVMLCLAAVWVGMAVAGAPRT
jgi:fluoride exporter